MRIGTVLYTGEKAQVIVTSFATVMVNAPDGSTIDCFYDEFDAIECAKVVSSGGEWEMTWTDEMSDDFDHFYRANCD